MKNVLIVSGHTDLNDSVANEIVLKRLKSQYPDAEFSILSEQYPDFKVDVEAEQEKLRRADIIVWQFPVFWYSMPSLMHRWVEDVFVHGFSHGSTGHALQGKKLIASFTTGGPEEYYSHEMLGYTIEELLMSQIRSIANLCGMQVPDFVFTGGVSYSMRSNPEELDSIKKLANAHADRLISEIDSL
ncbi:MAG: NAD(P)H-dependent oxidoreductase [Prevotella sp.]|nr:NAD(P)H-dependent oxidoreductase [Prevotella sp.]